MHVYQALIMADVKNEPLYQIGTKARSPSCPRLLHIDYCVKLNGTHKQRSYNNILNNIINVYFAA